ncbi:MAG: ClbS/DfsB family four-helix bundle protein [Colwellia sp.]|nr:ClbS/DfsB family four-helix bundle protein [Colwellia sp.]
MTSIPQNKLELYQAIEQIFGKLLVDYSSIPEEYVRKIGVEGNVKGIEITVCDTLAYLIGWGKLVVKWHWLTDTGKFVDFPETNYKWNELGELAQSFYHQYRDQNYTDLITEFKTTTNDILLLIDSLSNHDLYGTAWYKKYTLGKMIQFNTSSPMKNMRIKVRKFKRNNDIS